MGWGRVVAMTRVRGEDGDHFSDGNKQGSYGQGKGLLLAYPKLTGIESKLERT